jgi:hypothetical protein
MVLHVDTLTATCMDMKASQIAVEMLVEPSEGSLMDKKQAPVVAW